MLIELNIENFRSIKERVSLSLLASSDTSNSDNLIKTEVLKKDENLLKSAVIYGANAYGKTNLLEAFSILKQLVLNSVKYLPGDELPYQPFKLDPKCLNKPTKFEVMFIQKNIEYVYGISYTRKNIVEEYLYYYPKGKKAKIFYRRDSNEYDPPTVDKKIQVAIGQRTSENVLYLSNSAQQNYSKTREAFLWFREVLNVIGPTDNVSENITVDLIENEEFKKSIVKALSIADLGIDDVQVSQKQIQSGDLIHSPQLNLSFQNIPLNIPPNITKKSTRTVYKIENGKWTLKEIDIKTLHKVKDENGDQFSVVFDYDDESAGTQKMFSLIGPWIYAFLKGQVLIVDELDIHLHPHLTKYLINLFHDPTQNKSNAQLVFSTHNTNMLDLDMFRRDQIWFIDKNHETGVTELYSLAEYNPRKEKNIEKEYLVGRYGAIPFISSKKIL